MKKTRKSTGKNTNQMVKKKHLRKMMKRKKLLKMTENGKMKQVKTMKNP